MRSWPIGLICLLGGAGVAHGEGRFVEEKARVEAWQAMLDAPTWQPTVVKNPGSKGTMAVPGLDCGALGPATSRLRLEFKPGRHTVRHGVLRYRGDGAKYCLPSGVGVIEYRDGSRWVGEVANKGSLMFMNMLPFPSGVGQFTRADGSIQVGRAAPAPGKDWSWKFETVVLEQPATRPSTTTAETAATVSTVSGPDVQGLAATPSVRVGHTDSATGVSGEGAGHVASGAGASAVQGSDSLAEAAAPGAAADAANGAPKASPPEAVPPTAASPTAAPGSLEFAVQAMQGTWEYPAIGLSFRVEGDRVFVIKRAQGRRLHDDGMLSVYDIRLDKSLKRDGGTSYSGDARCRYYEGPQVVDVDCDVLFHHGGRQTFSAGMMQAHREGR